MNGLFNLNKPIGLTSHDVVQVVRRLTGVRRVGHTGTLDPLATGVLVLLVGPATRLARFLTGAQKSYRAVIQLGAATTTYDSEGSVTEQRPVTATRAQVEAELQAFRGTLAQIPPMYSAIKVHGQPLYKLARKGQQIERPARQITIHTLTLIAWAPPELTLEIICSAGTYIRSLAHDLGQVLGCGAYLRALTRTASGRFRLEDSTTLDQLRALAEQNRLDAVLHPPQAALYELPAVQLTPDQVQAMRHGRSITLAATEEAREIQALDPQGQLIGVLIPIEEQRWRPKLVLAVE